MTSLETFVHIGSVVYKSANLVVTSAFVGFHSVQASLQVCFTALQPQRALYIEKPCAASNLLRIKLLLAIGHQLQNLHLAVFKTVRLILYKDKTYKIHACHCRGLVDTLRVWQSDSLGLVDTRVSGSLTRWA